MAMDTHPSSRGIENPTSTIANVGDSETPAVNRGLATTNGHADTGLEKTLEVLGPDGIKIESSTEEGEERADDGSGTPSVSSDDGDGSHDVPLNNDRPNVCFSHLPPSSELLEAQDDFQGTHAVNEHLAPSNHIANHDTSGQHPEHAPSTIPDVSPPHFCFIKSFVKRGPGREARLPSRRATLSRFAADSPRKGGHARTLDFSQRKSASHVVQWLPQLKITIRLFQLFALRTLSEQNKPPTFANSPQGESRFFGAYHLCARDDRRVARGQEVHATS
jgi:hypothetical protein